MNLQELMEKATPLPWRNNYDGDPIQIGGTPGVCDRFVAMTLPCESDGAHLEDEANAALIVHCVNNFRPLVEALEAVKKGVNIGDRMLPSIQEKMIRVQVEDALKLAQTIPSGEKEEA